MGDPVTKRTYRIGQSTLTLQFGDLTVSEADVLVSSDDSYLSMGGGVSAAILRAGGENIMRDAAKKVPGKIGDVIVTTAGSLRAKYVFHAITIGDGGLEPTEIVARATRRCLELLDALGLSSIAFPAIGAGVAGFAYQDVAVRMAGVIVDSLKDSRRSVDATIYLYDQFRRMQPMDFLDFFEQFAVRTKGLGPAMGRQSRRQRAGRRASPEKKSRPTKQDQRKKLIEKLGDLDRERQGLEAKLAESRGILTKKEVRGVEKRLQEVHEERVEMLSVVKPKISSPTVSVFVSYAHADEKLRKELGKHLSILERQGLVSTWHDRMITAGTEWAGTIDTRLEEAAVILLLVSSDFVDSRYCYDIEMKRALERHERREALVIPVILRPVVLKGTPFAKIQALPKDARPATEWPSLDSAFVDVTEGLRDVVQGLGANAA